jgi:hypothetical protein
VSIDRDRDGQRERHFEHGLARAIALAASVRGLDPIANAAVRIVVLGAGSSLRAGRLLGRRAGLGGPELRARLLY